MSRPLFFLSWWLIIWNVFVKSNILRWLFFSSDGLSFGMVLLKFYYFGWFCRRFMMVYHLGWFCRSFIILGGFVEGLWWFIIWGWRSRAVAQEAIVGPPLSTSFKISSALGEVLFYNVAREVLKIEITFKTDYTNSVNDDDTICQNRWHCYRLIVRSQLYDLWWKNNPLIILWHS